MWALEPKTYNLKPTHPGAVLVYSLLILSTLLIVVTGFSLYVTRATRTLALSSDTAVATYVAESGAEEGLYLLRHEGLSVTDISTPAQPLASIASSASGDNNDLKFFTPLAFAELNSTSTISEILMDIPQDDVAYADVYDASRAPDLVESVIRSVKLQWDQGSNAAWLEASLVELNAQEAGAALRKPRTQVLGPSLHSGYCFSNLQTGADGTVNLHRLRFRALFGDIRNLRITGWKGTNCTRPPFTYAAVLPGRTTVSATGRYRNAKQTLQISMPQQTLPSGLFGFVVFSDQSLVKLSAGVGNLKFLPETTPQNTYNFSFPITETSNSSSTVSMKPVSVDGYAAPYFVLKNDDVSGSFSSGDIILSVSSNYANKLELAYDFPPAVLPPIWSGIDPSTKTCNDPLLKDGGRLLLATPGTTRDVTTGGETPVIIDRYWADRCAVGVHLDRSGITTASPLVGRLVAYADPGGTASMAINYSHPSPELRVEREESTNNWVAVTNNTTYNFNSVPEDTTATTKFRICNVGTDGTTLSINTNTVGVSENPVFTKQNESGPSALSRVTNVADCGSGDNRSFSVQFAPTAVAGYSGDLDIEPDEVLPFNLNLIGTGQAQVFTGAPSNLQVTWDNPFQFDATWDDGVTGETHYRVGASNPAVILRNEMVPDSDQLLNWNISGYCSTAGIDTVNPWEFYVVATNSHGFDADSPPTWTTRAIDSAVRPGFETPTNVLVKWNSANSATWSWVDNSSYESNYVISITSINGTSYATTTGPGITSYTSTTLQIGMTYTTKVRTHVLNTNSACNGIPNSRYLYGPESAAVVHTQPAGVKRILDSNPHDGNFEDDDGDTTNDRWHLSADAWCQSSLAPSFGGTWKALMWYRPGGGSINSIRPLPAVVTNGVTYVNWTNQLMFRATANNSVPSTVMAAPYCRTGSCSFSLYTTGYNSVVPQGDCFNWSYGGGPGTGAWSGINSDASQWLRHSSLGVCNSPTSRIYCVEQ